MSWTAEKRAAYMREYYRKNRDWIRVTFALWYRKNGPERNRRRRKQYRAHAAPRAGEAAWQALHVGSPHAPRADEMAN